MSTPIVVTGASGRMGRAILTQLAEAEGLHLAGATERAGHPGIGSSAEAAAGLEAGSVLLEESLEDALVEGAVMIDFTSPEATLAHLRICVERGARAVVGTTGLDATQREDLAALAQHSAIVHAPNMSVGVNLLFRLVEQAARALGDDFDVEIVEAHHRLKKDAPSGTAVRLLEGVARGLDRDPVSDAVHGREGLVGERGAREIGVHAVRGGDIVGTHEVIFAGLGETVEITHRATDRAIFARGAVRAARWVADRPAGLYDMADVLGL